MNIACFDVYYYETYAKSCCIIFNKEEQILSQYTVIVEDIEDYEPGKFYKRELPCILKALENVEEKINLIITDSFVLINEDRKGLGAHLYDALECKIPVIGVAKTFFKDAENYVEIYRGESTKPLYVSSIGIDLNYSADFKLSS
ncbi:endonuclease V [Clostridium peptidivorans]|uniref:endonuclease V n=1 Tax=Clostridium peptidivorans TaxID=100174 RepID=UPI000BE3ABA5|nr:endonuclease V [Clostridium peptidivorans]